MNQPRINPYVAVVIGVISVSASAIFVRLAGAPSGVTAFYRLFFSVLFMLPIFLLKYRHELKLITKRDWIFSIVSGVFLAFHFILWFESLNYTSVASSTVLVTLQPIFAFIGSYLFFKEKASVGAIVSGLLGISGSILISWGDFQISGSALFGDILALVSCAMVTVYLLFGQSVRKRLSLVTYTFVVYAISSITLLAYVMIVGEPLVNYSGDTWMYFILLAIVPTLLGHTLFNWALKWLNANTISISILFEPVGASILAYYILNESVIMTQVIGGFIILVGITLFVVSERKAQMKLVNKKSSSSKKSIKTS